MKKKIIKFRVTISEKLAIQRKAEMTGLSTSAYCRKAALQKQIQWKMSDEELEAYKGLKVIYNNFQLIANSWRTSQNAKNEISESLQLLKTFLNRIDS